jgi:hypothetical protein
LVIVKITDRLVVEAGTSAMLKSLSVTAIAAVVGELEVAGELEAGGVAALLLLHAVMAAITPTANRTKPFFIASSFGRLARGSRTRQCPTLRYPRRWQ